MVERHVEPGINSIDLQPAGWHKAFPHRDVFRIALVQLHRFGKHCFSHAWILLYDCCGFRMLVQFFGLCIDHDTHQPVEPTEFTGWIQCKCLLVAHVLPAPKNHSELRAPVAEVVVGDRAVPAKAEDFG